MTITVSKKSWLTWAIVLLLLGNLATMVVFWMDRRQNRPPAAGHPSEFLIQQLKLDAQQQKQFQQLVAEHQQAVRSLRQAMKEKKEALYQLLKSNATDSSATVAATAIGATMQSIDLATYQHFKKLRAICKPDQQQQFDAIILDVVSMMHRQGPPGPPGGHPFGKRGKGAPPPDDPNRPGPPEDAH